MDETDNRKCYCNHTAEQHHTTGKKLCKICPEYTYSYSGFYEHKRAGCLGLRLERLPKKPDFRVLGYSLSGNKRHVEVGKCNIQGQPFVSVHLNSPGLSSVKGLQAGITPDDARALAEALNLAAKAVEMVDEDKTKQKYKDQQAAKKRKRDRDAKRYKAYELRAARNEVARLEGKPEPYPDNRPY